MNHRFFPPRGSSLVLAASLLVATASFAAPPPAKAPAAAPAAASAYDRVLTDYDAVRLALVADSLGPVAAAAKRIHAEAAALAARPAPDAAAVPREALPQVTALLADLQKGATALATAKDLTAARQGFHQLTGAMLRWRQATGRGPAVAYCPMAKKQWLQSAQKPLGNPYMGKAMPTCGSITR